MSNPELPEEQGTPEERVRLRDQIRELPEQALERARELAKVPEQALERAKELAKVPAEQARELARGEVQRLRRWRWHHRAAFALSGLILLTAIALVCAYWFATTAGFQDTNNLQGEYSLSSFDSRQRLVASYVYELPIGKGRMFLSNLSGIANAVAGGWQIAAWSWATK